MSRSGYRLVTIYERLRQGRRIRVEDVLEEFDIDEDTFHHDIAMLREIIEAGSHGSDHVLIELNKAEGIYRMVDCDSAKFTPKEALALKELILSNGSFDDDLVESLIHKLKYNTSSEGGASEEMVTKYEHSYYKELMSMFGDVTDLIDKKLLK